MLHMAPSTVALRNTSDGLLYPPSQRSETDGYTVLLAFPSVRPSVRPCALIFRCKYLENGLRQRLGTN